MPLRTCPFCYTAHYVLQTDAYCGLHLVLNSDFWVDYMFLGLKFEWKEAAVSGSKCT